MLRIPSKADRRFGVTIVEMLVAIAVLGLLMGTLLPAIQSVRAAARRSTCSSHLHQLALAALNFESTTGRFPGSTGTGVGDILGNVEQVVEDSSRLGVVDVLLCPDEVHLTWSGVGEAEWSSSYLLNGGSAITITPTGGESVRPNGISHTHRLTDVRVKDVTDGTSNTALIGERRFTPYATSFRDADHVRGYCKRYPSMCVFALPQNYFNGEESEFAAACADSNSRTAPKRFIPHRTLALDTVGQVYDHLVTPNVPGCRWYSPIQPLVTFTNYAYAHTAASYHAGGVHLAFCDGNSRFMSSSVDGKVWRAIGSRDGSEPVASH